jgi:radical SAM superfamily enzyme YgiQ (UPF0313 family)
MSKKNVVVLFYPSPWQGEQRGRIPYALLYLERMIRGKGLDVILIDEQVTPDYLPILLKVKERLFLVGVSSMTGHQIVGGIRFSQAVKKLADVPVVWGGWHATLLPRQVLNEPYVDYVICGQGEVPFQKLVDELMASRDPSGISGLGSKKQGDFFVNPPASFQDINQFPQVNYYLLDPNQYVFKSAYSNRCIGYFCSHGCPYDCKFCCVAKIYGRKWYRKNVANIITDLKFFKERARIDSVTFDDDNFFVNKTFAMELARELINQRLDLLWDTSAHAGLFLKLFNEKDLELLYESGCRQVYIGAESGDQEVLNLIAKEARVEDNLRFAALLKRHRITPLFSTMVGFPDHPERDIRLTLDMIRRAKVADPALRARIFFYTPYPGTELYQKALEHGLKPPDRLEDWAVYTLRKFRAPWFKKDPRWKLEIFANFYLPLANPEFYKLVPQKQRWGVFVINRLFYPLIYLRFKWNMFHFPLEAICFLLFLRVFNKCARTQYALGYESYFDA